MVTVNTDMEGMAFMHMHAACSEGEMHCAQENDCNHKGASRYENRQHSNRIIEGNTSNKVKDCSLIGYDMNFYNFHLKKEHIVTVFRIQTSPCCARLKIMLISGNLINSCQMPKKATFFIYLFFLE